MHLKSQLLTKLSSFTVVQTQRKEYLEMQRKAAVALYADCLAQLSLKKKGGQTLREEVAWKSEM